ncbi:OLC1v1025028C1 [Oldenlandia corymbosa var. corymbosa]|uniref:OLC1v1025028C1 n=1 Tax=Oldenlandia corymbosa var. corymbosa TaxID=529605 RepID=A0AAV1C3T8_OLDCO|nr:OLC1v1025028C1 [Oldenlandia corymbosa var. corymbosa]
MNQLSRNMFHSSMKRAFFWQIAVLRQCLRSLWNHVLACWMGKSVSYRQLQQRIISSSQNSGVLNGGFSPKNGTSGHRFSIDRDLSSSDLVSLKISLLGDSQIGKTSFLAKYVGGENGGEKSEMAGINQMDKILSVKGARISYSMWEVTGDNTSHAHIPEACKDSVAIIFMFDLTSRCTLNSVIRWYKQARKWNQTALPVMVGTKFDEFIQLPIDLQWTIANEARTYAKAINATLFFSSATYNINVNKIFKFITAKLFNLPWTVERNLNIGEPLIDF